MDHEPQQPGDFGLLLDLYLRGHRAPDESTKFALIDALASELAIADQRAKVLLALLSLEAERIVNDEDVQTKVIVSHIQNKTPLDRKKTALYDLIKKAPDAGALLTDLLQREQALLQQAADDPRVSAAYRLAARARVIQMREATKRFIGRFNRIPISALLPFGAGGLLGSKAAAISGGATGAAAAGAATPAAAGTGSVAGVAAPAVAGTAGATSLGAAAVSGGGTTLVGAASQVIAQVANATGITFTQAATAVAATGLVAAAPLVLDMPREPTPIVALAEPDTAEPSVVPFWGEPAGRDTPTAAPTFTMFTSTPATTAAPPVRTTSLTSANPFISASKATKAAAVPTVQPTQKSATAMPTVAATVIATAAANAPKPTATPTLPPTPTYTPTPTFTPTPSFTPTPGGPTTPDPGTPGPGAPTLGPTPTLGPMPTLAPDTDVTEPPPPTNLPPGPPPGLPAPAAAWWYSRP
ncbi:hypothetical protein ACQP2T_61575 [Nonomuraea sp. CA-143628]|uniref:hypothetical protein n=1 Tax=Nonomuraea sp. CA-143628 TaxID=3239997 RepID=UPI003D8EFB43